MVMTTCSCHALMVVLLVMSTWCSAQMIYDLEVQPSFEQNWTDELDFKLSKSFHEYYKTMPSPTVSEYSQKLKSYVDWRTLTYQCPSVLLSGRYRKEFVDFLPVIATCIFLVLWMKAKSLGTKQELRVTTSLEVIALLFSCSSAKGDPILLQQTVPLDNSSVCPGQRLVYTCTTVSTGALEWQISDQEPVLFTLSDPVNFSKDQDDFTFQLIDKDLDGFVMISTATSEMASSDLGGLPIECKNGESSTNVNVDVAGPEDDLNISEFCSVIPSAMDESVVDLQIKLSTNTPLMCTVNYLVEFNGENKTVPIDSPSVNFTIDTDRERHSLEGMIYTLDNESRTGQNPSLFSIPGPPAVKNINLEHCETQYVLISWTPSTVTGCLNDDTTLEYMVEFPFADYYLVGTTSNAFAKLPFKNASEVNGLEVTITPFLPDLRLLGTPLSTVLNGEGAECSTKIASPTSPPTTSPSKLLEDDDDPVDVILQFTALIAGFAVMYLILLAILLVMYVIKRKKRKIEASKQNMPERNNKGHVSSLYIETDL